MATALINVLLAHNVYSAPIPPHNMTCFVQNVSDGCNDLRNCRTMSGIVYSCLLTVFACIWTAVHPDVPEPDDGIWSLASRVGLAVASLFLPEAILAFAWRQFLMSWRISKKCKMVGGWTPTHSYFVVMGGFFDSSKRRPVDPNDLQRYPGIIKNATITKKKILDRSKVDAFSKFIVVVQLLWFVTQYIGRWTRHLHRSQLETMTLAYAALSLFVYVLWWHKPVNVQLPIDVMPESPSVPPTSEIHVDQPSPKTELDADPISPMSKLEFLFIMAATGMIFGGIHCLAWSFPFPTRTEIVLWRVSAIYITVAPVFVVLGEGRNTVLRGFEFCSPWWTAPLILPVYVAARVILFVLTFTSLRSPPLNLYQTPSWLPFFAHFG
ncbi:uncharacterized protein EI90DRAFT_3046607 [Cantharellus anzutake]|uniref:uncharacterized protein n=1 Tax=Cantharellus anzutake TaxID=1750568 RepID=UPI001905DE13|nr:uncharacterized protein EI90DRAFT_3046607 [Cantharellus anzutake]KAF8336640.1 hypothetical protein EI90DRAFT_3046607 [Cantharellus anzutake]